MFNLIAQSFKMALISFRTNKGRSALTVLGIVIGIASVIIVFSAGEGIRGLLVGQVESFGTDIVETEIKVPTGKTGAQAEQQSGAAIAQGVQITTLTLKDMEAIDRLPNVSMSYAGIMSQDQASYDNEVRKVSILGVNASYIDIDKSEVEYGQFYTDADDRSLAQVVVLGSEIKQKLFGDSDPIGKSIKLHKSKYEVVGVLKSKGSTGFINFDNYIYVPIRTLQKKMMGIDHVFYIVSKLVDVSQAERTAEDVRYLLTMRHNISDPLHEDFRVVTMEEMLKTLDTVTNAITYLLLAIVVISLVVGGVGIMNVMYVIVSERTAEIGLRKAVGAKYSDIMWQFLVEAVMVSVMGGIFGILIGVVVSYALAYGASTFGFAWKFSVPIRAFIVSLGFSSFFGIVFGVYPARKAALMSPMEALRSE